MPDIHYIDRTELRDGRIILYKNSQLKKQKNWQMRLLKPDGGYLTRTTKTPSLGEAASIAEDCFDEMRDNVKKGLPSSTINFRELWIRWIRLQGDHLKDKRRKSVFSQMELYFLPYFGTIPSPK